MAEAEALSAWLVHQFRSDYRFIIVSLGEPGPKVEELRREGFTIHVVGRRPRPDCGTGDAAAPGTRGMAPGNPRTSLSCGRRLRVRAAFTEGVGGIRDPGGRSAPGAIAEARGRASKGATLPRPAQTTHDGAYRNE